jgi:hypothetical protein
VFVNAKCNAEDPILTDIQPMWGEKLPCGWKVEDEDLIPDGGKHSLAGYPVTTPHSRILEREGVMLSYNQEREGVMTNHSKTSIHNQLDKES